MQMASWKNYDKWYLCLAGLVLSTVSPDELRISPDPSRQPQHENQHFGDGLVKLGRNLVADLDMGQGARQHLVFLDRNVVGLGDFDDLGADDALALGDDPGRAGLVVMQRDRKPGSWYRRS